MFKCIAIGYATTVVLLAFLCKQLRRKALVLFSILLRLQNHIAIALICCDFVSKSNRSRLIIVQMFYLHRFPYKQYHRTAFCASRGIAAIGLSYRDCSAMMRFCLWVK
ncbi:hypothetical protein Y032_0009g389 [Ancylostoma ceylanicum]|uniref:Uncharacterized protein n=1 Tax=Ancylostoma ceylanicum TaxID=53326 RepID=A0A016VJA9_9BILA|nr:hypothetical protein Y032_0009g389 [Ancylostoma ceylanicum]